MSFSCSDYQSNASNMLEDSGFSFEEHNAGREGNEYWTWSYRRPGSENTSAGSQQLLEVRDTERFEDAMSAELGAIRYLIELLDDDGESSSGSTVHPPAPAIVASAPSVPVVLRLMNSEPTLTNTKYVIAPAGLTAEDATELGQRVLLRAKTEFEESEDLLDEIRHAFEAAGFVFPLTSTIEEPYF